MSTTVKTKVEVRPIEKPNTWHGKTGIESFSQPVVYEVLYSSAKGGYDTGLSEEDAERLGKKLRLDLSSHFDPESGHPYWGTKGAQIKLENRTMFFDPANDRDYIKIQNMKASRFIANSMKEYVDGLWPDATHVIYDENDEVTDKEIKINKKYAAIGLVGNMSTDEKISVIQILSDKSYKNRSPSFINTEIDNIIERDVDSFLRYAKMDKAEVYTRAAILEAIDKNIITKEGLSLYYMGDKIGMDYDSTVDWFMNPQNQKMKVSILERLNPNLTKTAAVVSTPAPTTPPTTTPPAGTTIISTTK